MSTTRAVYERKLEDRLQELVTAEESIGTTPAGRGGFCITYKFPQHDIGDATTSNLISKPEGFRGEIISLLRYNVTETFTHAETVDIGIVSVDTDAMVDGGTFPTTLLAAGVSDRMVIVPGTTPIIPIGAAQIICAITSTSTAGICDLALTIRWYL